MEPIQTSGNCAMDAKDITPEQLSQFIGFIRGAFEELDGLIDEFETENEKKPQDLQLYTQCLQSMQSIRDSLISGMKSPAVSEVDLKVKEEAGLYLCHAIDMISKLEPRLKEWTTMTP